LARIVAVLRLLQRLSKKEMESFSSAGLNNLFLCVAFLASGSHSPRTAFWSAFPFLIILLVPLLFAVSADALKRLPPARWKLWPLDRTGIALLRILNIAMNPAAWVGAVVLLAWAGAAPCVAFILLAVAIQLVVALGSYGLRGHSSMQILRYVPRFPTSVGGILQVSVRQLGTTMDFYTALILCISGALYRFLSRAPDASAFPIVSLLIALTLSTYAQRSFGLDGRSGITRYRLLPIQGWRILLAKDAAFLGVTTLLVLPFSLRVGVTCSLVCIAIGRWPSIHQSVVQRRWRFTGGDIRFGVVQVIGGGMLGINSSSTSLWFLAAALVLYVASLIAGDRWWQRVR
jgi:hypothetical protein